MPLSLLSPARQWAARLRRWYFRRLLASGRFPMNRELLSWVSVQGTGLEIGALHQPLQVSEKARVRYVDRMSVSDLRAHYPELTTYPLVPVDIVDDGEKLATVADASQDFVIANHFLEHTQDPIGTLKRFLDVVKPGGLVYLAVPDKRGTFDRNRPVTPFEHVERDHVEGPNWSEEEHYREYLRHIHPELAADIEVHVRHMIDTKYSIHFHVWTHPDFFLFLDSARRRFGLPLEVEVHFYHQAMSESIALLRRV